MGLKCSVLGHAYGETTVERDREERGSEVVITIRELETCERCGDTRVVTENKEVTTIETPDDRPDVTAEDAMAAMGEDADASGTADAAAADATGGSESAGEALVDDAEGGAAVTDDAVGPASPDDVADEGAEILDADADDGEPVDDELADPTIDNDADVPGEDAEEDDAVIIDDAPAAGGPDDADGTAAPPGSERSGPDPSGADRDDAAGDAAGSNAGERDPFDAPPEEDDGPEDLGEWPEETLRDTDDDWTPSEDLTGTIGDVEESEVDRDLSPASAVTVPEGEFHCGECGYTTDVEATSLRAGDYCPECRTGTLVHRAEE